MEVDARPTFPLARQPSQDQPAMFSGELEVTMDEKGRVIVPIRYREELGANVVMLRGMDGQITIYPKGLWQQSADRLAQEQTHQNVRDARWLLFSGNEIEMDRQGRVVIPPLLRRHAKLDSDVVIIGVSDHLELWSLECWEEKTRQIMLRRNEICDQMADLGVTL
jgi:MraZ protein